MTSGAVGYENCLTSILEQIRAAIYAPTAKEIDADLAADSSVDLPGPFSADNSGVDAVLILKTIYLPPPYPGIFVERYLSPTKAWSNARDEVDF